MYPWDSHSSLANLNDMLVISCKGFKAWRGNSVKSFQSTYAVKEPISHLIISVSFFSNPERFYGGAILLLLGFNAAKYFPWIFAEYFIKLLITFNFLLDSKLPYQLLGFRLGSLITAEVWSSRSGEAVEFLMDLGKFLWETVFSLLASDISGGTKDFFGFLGADKSIVLFVYRAAAVIRIWFEA